MIYKYKTSMPTIGNSVFIAPSADVIGDVTIGADCGIWFNTTIRGDVHYIKIGQESNIQDNSILHVTNGKFPLNLGNRITVGHGVTLHGCTINDHTLIGMGAIILDGAEVGQFCIVAAGSLIREKSVFPDNVLIAGSPVHIIRPLRADEKNKNLEYARNYIAYKNIYLDNTKFTKIKEIHSE
jgi:carbonic anhydrase/acetyltransferase-like protein (isoleucine patch superfamily)